MDNNILKTFRTTVMVCDKPYPYSGRVYPKAIIRKALDDELFKDRLKNKMVFGELSSEETKFTDGVNFSDIAFSATKFYWYKNKLRAKIDILNTPNGRVLKDVMKKGDGSRLHFTLTGNGDVDFESKTVTNYTITKLLYVAEGVPVKED